MLLAEVLEHGVTIEDRHAQIEKDRRVAPVFQFVDGLATIRGDIDVVLGSQ